MMDGELVQGRKVVSEHFSALEIIPEILHRTVAQFGSRLQVIISGLALAAKSSKLAQVRGS